MPHDTQMISNVTVILLNQSKSGTHIHSWMLRTSRPVLLGFACPPYVRTLGLAGQQGRSSSVSHCVRLKEGGSPASPSLRARLGLGSHRGGSQSHRGQCPSPPSLGIWILLPRVGSLCGGPCVGVGSGLCLYSPLPNPGRPSGRLFS